MDDDPEFSLQPAVERALDFLDCHLAAGRPTLVHCQAGISRSATVILSYLITRKGMSLREAFLLVKERRPQVQPNHGFFKYLEELEWRTRGERTFVYGDYIKSVLVDMGVEEARAADLIRRYGTLKLDVLMSMAFN
jgi:protein-tyrosine phosphatase